MARSSAVKKPEPRRGFDNPANRDRIIHEALKGAGETYRAEAERLRKLGIIDEHGNLLKKPSERKPGDSSDFGGWG
jgi:hypothetical protein